ncbi:hypothetical protein Fcan01_21943 [Folsomia candida]|uniref:Uncharacterized protein n=1 Tax=Folsomia candida TaxID=158441 RepID=A0A226DFS2_FOLCA|nr:hypothetical protein Fcan01_21943 [Folsomia candida]
MTATPSSCSTSSSSLTLSSGSGCRRRRQAGGEGKQKGQQSLDRFVVRPTPSNNQGQGETGAGGSSNPQPPSPNRATTNQGQGGTGGVPIHNHQVQIVQLQTKVKVERGEYQSTTTKSKSCNYKSSSSSRWNGGEYQSTTTKSKSCNYKPRSRWNGGEYQSTTTKSKSCNYKPRHGGAGGSINPQPPSPNRETRGGAGSGETGQHVFTESEKKSFSRCTVVTQGFVPETFKITKATPNSNNDCDNGVFIDIQQQEEIERECESEQRAVPPPDNDREQAVCRRSQLVQTFMSFGATHSSTPEFLHPDLQGDVLDAYSISYPALRAHLPEIVQARQNEERILEVNWRSLQAAVKKIRPSLEPWLEERKTKFWEWLQFQERMGRATSGDSSISGQDVDEATGTTIAFTCSLCSKYHGKGILHEGYENALAKPQGYATINEKTLKDVLTGHHRKDWHKEALRFEQEKKELSLKHSLEIMQDKSLEKLGQKEQATALMLMTVYGEVRMGVAANKHSTMCDLLEFRGVNIGYHHQDKNAWIKMVTHMSDEMQVKYLTRLTKRQRPIALITDTTTDSMGVEVFVVLIQSVEEGAPVVLFLGSTRMGIDTTGKGYLGEIKKMINGISDLKLRNRCLL